MIARIFKSFVGRVSELVFAIAVVVVFFALFLVILSLSFPQATNLGDLLFASDDGNALLGQDRFELQSPGAANTDSPKVRRGIARLSSVVRRVKDKTPTGLAWTESTAGTRLAEGHAVQTLSRASATIEFDDTNHVTLEENALLIIQQARRATVSAPQTSALVVLQGELSATLDPRSSGAGVEVVAGQGPSALHASPGAAGPASFRVTAGKDQSSTVTVYDGTTTVEANGRKVEVKSHEFVSVAPDGRMSKPRRLPPPTTPHAPADGALIAFHTLAPRVGFEWSPVDGAERYRFDLARDPEFRETLYEVPVTGTTFSHGNLKPGRYWWRVSTLAEGIVGPPSATRELRVVEDVEPPTLQVAFPETVVEGGALVLRGEAELGADVFIGKERLVTDETGSFVHTMALEPGANLIVVHAVDAAGNISIASKLVRARF